MNFLTFGFIGGDIDAFSPRRDPPTFNMETNNPSRLTLESSLQRSGFKLVTSRRQC